ncbi:MAG: alpha/beta hydrolase, partial [Muribaculaceae bacterium]|nr:alpha/beta hydrolase [Muribaculaceae bacterium]
MEKSFDTTHTAATGWTGDILGKDFERRTIVHPSDYDGPVCCTVVRLRPLPDAAPASRGVLYVHGFSDYFFQAEMARMFRNEGYAFYAVDLRKYGRSVLAGQKPFRVRDLREYFPDIEAALRQMADDGITSVVLLAHSTGGLICSLMMKECPPPQVAAMILNSPFLAWNLPAFMRKVAVPAVSWLGRFMPGLPASQPADPLYARSLHKKYDGEWDYNRHWKPDTLPPVDAGWIRAIDTAQRSLKKLRPINVPVLLLHSDSSAGRHDSLEAHHRAAAILNVESIAQAGRELGALVSAR